MQSQDGRAGYKEFLLYIVVLFIVFLGLSSVSHVAWLVVSNDESRDLVAPVSKLNYLHKHNDDFELILWGDSRTFIGVDPEIVGRELDMPALNLGSMAHWFPTQYPQLKRMVRSLKGKHLVWIIGAINFQTLNPDNPDVNENFSLNFAEFLEYRMLGFSSEVLWDNLLASFLPSHSAIVKKNLIQGKLDSLLDKQFCIQFVMPHNCNTIGGVQDSNGLEYSRFLMQARQDLSELYPDAMPAKIVDGQSAKAVMLSALRLNRQQVFYELDSQYLRSQQIQWEAELGDLEPESELMWQIFEKMLNYLQIHDVDVTVVEYRDAPYQTRNAIRAQGIDERMARVREQVESKGFTYLVPDMSQLSDAHYFDYNHLNTTGSQLYSQILASELSRVIR